MNHPLDSKFAALPLRRYTNTSFGISFNAPSSWLDTSDEYFQISDEENGAEFACSAYLNNNGLSPEAWANARRAAVEKNMPFLQPMTGLYQMDGRFGTAFAAEFSGVFPESRTPSRCLVLCLHTQEKLISFTVTSPETQFVKHEALYRWLLATQLTLVSNIAVRPNNIIPKLQHMSAPSVRYRVMQGRCPSAKDSDPHLYLHVMGDVVISYTVPGALAEVNLPLGAIKEVGLDQSTVHPASLENLCNTLDGTFRVTQLSLTPSGPAPTKVDAALTPMYFSMDTGGGLEASCILLPPIWESVAHLVKGDLRIAIPRQNACLFCGADDPWLPMMISIAEQIRTERPDLALSAYLFGISDGTVAPIRKLAA
jgi:hypothetical protein